MIVKNKFYWLSSYEKLFFAFFLFWFIGGIASKLLRETEFSIMHTGYVTEYGSAVNPALQYACFIFVFIVVCALLPNSFSARDVREEAIDRTVAKISLGLAFLAVLVKIYFSGVSLFSGNYYARFSTDLGLLTNIAPTLFCLIALNSLSKIGWKSVFGFRISAMTALIAAISLLAGSRSTAFFVGVGVLYAYSVRSYVYEQRSVPTIKFQRLMLLLFVIYSIGQLVNAIRWEGLSLTGETVILSILGDSFPEFRSHSYVQSDVGGIGWEYFGILRWMLNFSAYFFPEVVYNAFDLSRSNVFNMIWTEYFRYIFWGNQEDLFGIRVGLIGEISLALGPVFLIPVAILYAFMLRFAGSHSFVVAVCLISTIPYGLTAAYQLIYVLLLSWTLHRLVRGFI